MIMIQDGEEAWKPLTEYLETFTGKEGIDTPKGIIKNHLLNYSKSEVEAAIIGELKNKFHFTGAQVSNLKQFYKELMKEKEAVKIPFNVIGDRIRTATPIFTMRDTKEIYIYKNGVYKNNHSDSVLDREIRDECKRSGQVATREFVAEVMAYLRAFTFFDRKDVDEGKYINFTNGLYNRDTEDLEEHTSNYCSIRQIPVNYNPEAECPAIEKFLSEVVEPKDIPLIYEWLGLSLVPVTRFGKAMMLYGRGANGKSVFLNMLVQFLGIENISKESLQNLETKPFSVANLYGKLMNICSDLPSTTLHEADIFKQLTGNDMYIRGEEKYKSAFQFLNTARLTFSANDLPKGKIDYAFSRRWILIPFPNTFENNQDKDLIEKLTTEAELSGLLNLALKGLKRLLENGEFSNYKSVDATQKEYVLNSNPVQAFLDARTEPSDGRVNQKIMYEWYEIWAEGHKIKVMGYNRFCKEIKWCGVENARPGTWCAEKETYIKTPEFVGISIKPLIQMTASDY
jgi:putative DNA primase/helicase